MRGEGRKRLVPGFLFNGISIFMGYLMPNPYFFEEQL